MRIRLGPLVRALAALVAVGALLGGVPYVLVRFVGWPLPRHVPSLHQAWSALSQHGMSNIALIDILAVALWIAWAVLALAFLVEGAGLVANREPRRVLVAGRLQPLAGALLGAVVLSLAASFARGGGGGVSLPRAAITVPIRSPESNMAPRTAWPVDARLDGVAKDMTEPIAAQLDAAVVRGARPAAEGRTYVVRDDDTLWGIAASELGDAARWQVIFEMNRGVPQRGGGALENPHWIYPGWVLHLPSPDPSKEAVPGSATPSPTAVPGETTQNPATVPSTTTPPTTVPTTSPPAAPVGPTGPTRPAVPANDRSAERPGDVAAKRAGPNAPVRLPSGSVVGGAFAIGVLGALALARQRRRHGYRYRSPSPGRRLDAEPLGPTLRALGDAVTAPSDDPDAEPVVVPAVPADADADHRERPDFVEIGDDGDEERAAMLSELTGACFVGAEADSIVRSLICELLMRAGPIAAEVLTTEASVERLFPGMAEHARRGTIPGVRVVASDDAICSLLEAEAIARTRQFALDDVDGVLSYRQACPWDPLPTVIALVGHLEEASASRWQALFADGARLGLGAIVLDPSGYGDRRIEVAADWSATSDDPLLAPFVDGLSLFRLRAEEANEILRTHLEVEERPTSDDGPERGLRLVEGDSIGVDIDSADEGTCLEEAEPWPELDESIGAEQARGLEVSTTAMSEPALAEAIETPNGPQPPKAERSREASSTSKIAPSPIAVRVFGSFTIAVNGRVVDKGLRSVVRELLAWYLLRPEGTSIGAAVEACWPDTDPRAVSNTFWRPAGDLRKLVGQIAEPPTKLIDDDGDHLYRLDRAAIDCDLWQFQAALATAARAEQLEVARDALREAVDCFGGEFLEGYEYFWVAPVREDLHRRALDAHVRLAELEEELGNPDGAEAMLQAATDFDRFAEEPYRRLMALQAGRHRLDSVTATWRLLERRLAEIDIDPEQATLRVYRSLTAPTAQQPGGTVERLRRPS